MTNKTFTSIHVECTPGYDGGLQQSFVIEVFPVGAVDLGLEIGGADGGASLVSLEVEIEVLKPHASLSYNISYLDWRSGGGVILDHRVGPERGGADLPDRSSGEPALSQLLRREPAVGDGVRHGRLRAEQQGELLFHH